MLIYKYTYITYTYNNSNTHNKEHSTDNQHKLSKKKKTTKIIQIHKHTLFNLSTKQ